jgi:hypothetical protein
MLERPVPDSPFVSFEPGALSVPPWSDEEPDGGSTDFYLTGLRPQEIGEALHAISEKLMAVAEDGRILTDDEDEVLRTPDAEAWDVLYTPNYVSPVSLSAEGASLYLDTKGEVYGPMVRTMVALIVEELTARQVTARFAVRPDGVEFNDDLHSS